MEPTGKLAGGGLRRFAFHILALVAFVLALAGVVLPGLPATPFLLLAAWAAARGSPELSRRIETHPHLGPLLRNWRERRVVPTRAKILAVLSMALSFILLVRSDAPAPVLVGVAIILVGVASFLLTRPSH